MNTNTKKKLDNKYNPYNLFLETWLWCLVENKESTDTTSGKSKKKKESVDLSDMLSLEGDEEVKERKGLKLQKNY